MSTKIEDIKGKIHPKLYDVLSKQIIELRPAQSDALNNGLLEGNNLLICTPTASGKTLIAELAGINNIYNKIGKAVYIAPLKAIASEKYKEFKNKYFDLRFALSIGDFDSVDSKLSEYDFIFTTSEKLDSIIRHHSPWLRDVKTIIIDEIHLLNDSGRGPTLEILITILRKMLKNIQIIGLSATIGNPNDLANWLSAKLIINNWRPVQLKQGIYHNGEIEFQK